MYKNSVAILAQAILAQAISTQEHLIFEIQVLSGALSSQRALHAQPQRASAASYLHEQSLLRVLTGMATGRSACSRLTACSASLVALLLALGLLCSTRVRKAGSAGLFQARSIQRVPI